MIMTIEKVKQLQICLGLPTPYIDGCTHIYISIFLLPTLLLLGKHYLLSGLYSIRLEYDMR